MPVDQELKLQTPDAYGIEPPEGKQLSDFVGWMGFEDKDEPYGKDEKVVFDGVENYLSNMNNLLMHDSTIVFKDRSRNLNVYPVWELYAWVDDSGYENDQGYADIIYTGMTDKMGFYNMISQAVNRSTFKHDVNGKDKYGFEKSIIDNKICGSAYSFGVISGSVWKNEYETTQDENGISIDYFVNLVPNFNVKIELNDSRGGIDWHFMQNVYVNGNLFAGKNVTEEYWNDHQNDLYKNVDHELSGEFMWGSEGINLKSKTLIFPITSCHVSSDNVMHISCEMK